MSEPWLTLIGIGEDGRDGLSTRARAALDNAKTIIGGKRHLALGGPLCARTLIWPSPIDAIMPDILALRGQPVVVLATGDPFHYGVGTMLSRHVAPAEMRSFPQPSAFSLAASRLCWSLQEVACVSLHGRDDASFSRQLAPGARMLILSWDGGTPARLATILRDRGFGASRMTVLEAMGGPRENRRATTADGFDIDGIDPLNTIALECVGADANNTLSCLPDDAFEHDGQITKQAIRAVTLTALAPRGNELLWDVGAGSGSVTIEWLRADRANRAIAIESRPDRAERIARNAARHGVAPEIVVGDAPGAFADYLSPDAIFIGGAVGDEAVVRGAMDALKTDGRLVANAITLESQAHLVALHRTYGGTLTQMQHARAEPVGRFSGWRAAMPVVQWRWIKP